MTFGTFIAPYERAEDIEALRQRLSSHIRSGYRSVSDSGRLMGQNRIYDRIVTSLRALELGYEDQCSAQYYFDLVRTLRDFNGQFDRVVEVGVFMGGSTSYLTGCIAPFDYDLDLVDVCAAYLRFAYERVRRMYPESAGRIRLFHGDLPSYVREVMVHEPERRSIVHHDGSHEFNQVVKDIGALSYVQQSVLAIIAQDTHLRGSAKFMNFVDMALYAVFGTDLKYAPIGAVYEEHSPMTSPDGFYGNYFMPNVAEGVVLPMAVNRFQFPHPAHKLDDLQMSPEDVARFV